MSDASDAAGAVGGGISVVAVVWFLLRRIVGEGDKARAGREADLRAEVASLRHASEKHREQLEQLKRTAVELDTRLKFREGAYGSDPLTSPGFKLPPEIQERIAEVDK